MAKKRGKGAYMISAVAEMYGIHPQTLRLYEREGLLAPSRSDGNTRLYTEEDLKRLEFILELAREYGVNISGIDMILRMRESMETMKKQMEMMQSQMQDFIHYVQTEMLQRVASANANPSQGALVPVRRTPDKGKVILPGDKKK